MKVLFCLFILAVAACAVLANVETCSEVDNCSEAMKTKCDEMSKSLEGLGDDRKFILTCKNGICMCNVEFPEIVIKHSSCEKEEKEKGKEENADQDA